MEQCVDSCRKIENEHANAGQIKKEKSFQESVIIKIEHGDKDKEKKKAGKEKINPRNIQINKGEEQGDNGIIPKRRCTAQEFQIAFA